MRAETETAEGAFQLRAPETAAEWDAYHAVRESPAGRADPAHPMVLISGGVVLGALGLGPLDADIIEIRDVTAAPARRRRGLGAVMMALAERAAAAEGFNLAVVSAPLQAMPFCAQNGYRHEAAAPAGGRGVLPPAPPAAGAVWMGKRLDLGVAQSPPTVFIQAA